MDKPAVFVSYSHKDERWKDRLVAQLGVLEHQGLVTLWDDRRIGAGAEWEQEIQTGMEAATVAVILISANSLTSHFILRREVTQLLQQRDRAGTRIFPIIVKPCDWQAVDWLRRMQCRPRDGVPLSTLRASKADEKLSEIAREVRSMIGAAPMRRRDHADPRGGGAGNSGWSLHLRDEKSSPTGTFYIPRDEAIVIGRGADAELRLPADDRRVSRRHAVIRFEAGAPIVEDCGSKNGTFVNGVRRDRAVLRHRDLLRVGRTEMLVMGNELPTETASGTSTSTEGE